MNKSIILGVKYQGYGSTPSYYHRFQCDQGYVELYFYFSTKEQLKRWVYDHFMKCSKQAVTFRG